jgi:predicted GIY-YIG superfamily endonuclease
MTHLKEYRLVQSAADKIPIYSVFGDTVMLAIAQARPSTPEALKSIRGFTEEKCERYGNDVLRLVGAFPSLAPPPTQAANSKPVVLRHSRHQVNSRLKSTAAISKKSFDVLQLVKRTPAAGKEGIYVLELTQGRVYVGQSSDVRRRVQQHMSGQGSAFTKAFPPTGVLLPRLGCVTGSAEAAERDETLRYMFLRGIPLVRGWKYSRVQMTEDEQQDAEENIRELFDLCRRCGHPGHFITRCKATFDRLGRPCKP